MPEAHQAHSDRSDGALSVVTVHRSKGLEYPVVICPYLWPAAGSRRGGRLRPGGRWQPPGAADPTLDLHLNSDWGPGWAAAEQANAAEAAEQERLAYVALTRAQHLLVLAWGPAQDQQHNPLQPWLFLNQAPDDDDPVAVWRAALEQSMEERGLAIRVLDPAPVAMEPTPVSPPPPDAHPLSTGPVPQRPMRSRWGRSSYTSWTRSVHGASPEALEEGRDIDDPGAESPEEPRGDWPDQGTPLAVRTAGNPRDSDRMSVAPSANPGSVNRDISRRRCGTADSATTGAKSECEGRRPGQLDMRLLG